jgi:hypothetical protein
MLYSCVDVANTALVPDTMRVCALFSRSLPRLTA